MSKTPTPAPYAGDVAVLFPGEPVSLTPDGKAFAIVYPMKVSEIAEYAQLLWRLTCSLMPEQARSGTADPDAMRDALVARLPEVVPQLVTSSWELVRSHTRPDPDDFPPELVPEVVMAFVRVNFLNPARRKNWVAAAEAALLKLTGTPISISEIISNFSLPLATISSKLSVLSSMIDGAGLSLTQDGPYPSSGTGSTEQPPAELTPELSGSTT